MARIKVALKDNKIVTIDDVERGLDCGCVCLHCYARLEARKGDVREHHFAHHGAQPTLACYEYAFRVVTKKAFTEAGEINLPINRLNEENEVVNEVFTFKYNSVEILDSDKRSGNGLEILVELKNEKDVPLDVLICTSNKNRKNLESEIFRENVSRIRINLTNFQVMTYEGFRRFLAKDIQNKEWIYNRKAENKIKESANNNQFDNKQKSTAFKNNQIKNIRNTSDVLHDINIRVNSVMSNQTKVVETTSNQRSSEEFRKMGVAIWEEKFKGKR